MSIVASSSKSSSTRAQTKAYHANYYSNVASSSTFVHRGSNAKPSCSPSCTSTSHYSDSDASLIIDCLPSPYSSDWSTSPRSSATSVSSASSSSSSSLLRRSRRPLPRIPSPPPLSTGSVRPLPTIPQGTPSSHPPRTPSSVRPLPSLDSPRPERARQPPPHSDPLPAPTTARDSGAAPPKLNIILGFQSTPKSPVEVISESPIGPITPISFNREEYKKQRRSREDKLAIRLSAFGFVEVDEPSKGDPHVGTLSDDKNVVVVVEEDIKGPNDKYRK